MANKKLTPGTVGEVTRKTRTALGMTQRDLALTSGTGLRFISELEKGKPSCQFGKVLMVLQTLGIQIELRLPVTTKNAGTKNG